MKSHLIIFIFLLQVQNSISQRIEFMYVGDWENSRHFSNLIVSPHIIREIDLKREDRSYTRIVLSEDKVFDLLVNFTKKSNTHKELNKNNVKEGYICCYPNGAYLVNIYLKNDSISYLLENKEESLDYFNNLAVFLRKHNYPAVADIYNKTLLVKLQDYKKENNSSKISDQNVKPKRFLYLLLFIFGLGILIFLYGKKKHNKD